MYSSKLANRAINIHSLAHNIELFCSHTHTHSGCLQWQCVVDCSGPWQREQSMLSVVVFTLTTLAQKHHTHLHVCKHLCSVSLSVSRVHTGSWPLPSWPITLIKMFHVGHKYEYETCENRCVRANACDLVNPHWKATVSHLPIGKHVY